MVIRIEIISKTFDTRAIALKNRLNTLPLSKKIKTLRLLDVYTIDKPLNEKESKKIAEILSNPVTQSYTISVDQGNSTFTDFTYAFEFGFLPGVTDNLGQTVRESIEDLLKKKFGKDENAYSSQVILLDSVSKKDIPVISSALINPLIQRVHVKSYDEYKKGKGMDFIVPKVTLHQKISVDDVDLNVSDEELEAIGKHGIKNSDGTRRGPLALNLLYMKTIQKYFKKKKRKPTDIELESIAQTWSEHCKHTIFRDPLDEIKNGLFKSYIKKATDTIRKKKGKKDICVSVFTDNSGAIEYDAGYLVTHKVETHNSPSALDPFGGAVTGIVGVNRDALGFGLGAKPVINSYGYCFAPPDTTETLYRDREKTRPMLSPRRIMDGVIRGVNNGGNCSGIPTPQGFMYFDPRYQGKPLVFVGTVGLIPKKIGSKKSYVKQARPGDYIVMIGGRVGADGIHGATFSSVALDEGSPAAAVQIGDPITQKKLSDALIREARDLLLYSSVTDDGAGGLSCSVAEMAKEAGGCEVYLEKVPLKYPGLTPWMTWISESQERMTLAVPPTNWKKFLKIMEKHGVEATIIGKFTKSASCVVKLNNTTIMDVDLEFLHEGLPQEARKTKKITAQSSKLTLKDKSNYSADIEALMGRLNMASFEFISEQYDYIVQGNAVVGPLQGKGRINGESSVTRPLLSSNKGVVLSQAIYPSYSEIDPYNMAYTTIDTAIRNTIVAGANPEKIALLDNFCWCDSNNPERLYQLKEAVRACYDAALAYEAPFISGKDSMFNDFRGFDEKGKPISISVPPTLLVTSIGIADSLDHAVTMDFKSEGDLLYLLGETSSELAGSEYLSYLNETGKKKTLGSRVPRVDAKLNKTLYETYYRALKRGYIASGTSLSRGGLAAALAKSSMSGMLGCTVNLAKMNVKTNYDALFSESSGRTLVSVNPKNQSAFEKLFVKLPARPIGVVNDFDTLVINEAKKEIVNVRVSTLLESYRTRFKGY